MIKMNRLFEKVSYFNNHYVYYTKTGTRPYLSSESNGIDIDTAEYTDVIDNKFDTVIDSVTDVILIPFKEEGD